jgi:RNA polymerase sigma-70 factor (ECF subfamily)
MDTPSTFTTLIHEKVDRMRRGDRAASDELLATIRGRLEKLTRKMLRAYPIVQRWSEADDVMQNASLRLLRALQVMQPASTRDFFNLAAVQIRRELIDLTRHFNGPLGVAQHHDSVANFDGSPQVDKENSADANLDSWAEFHVAVDKLAEEERETFSLIFYHGWKQEEVAEFCDVNVRTIRRRWAAAVLALRDTAKDLKLD